MKTKLEQFLVKNPNPVFSVERNGTIFYSNEAGKLFLKEWGVSVGEPLPPDMLNFIGRGIFKLNIEKLEVKVAEKVFLLNFHPLNEEECITVYGFDITDQKKLEEKLRKKEKQNEVLHQIGKTALEDESLQTFMDKTVKLITGILDLEYCKIMEFMPDGKFLLRAGTGWKPEYVGKNIVGAENGSQAGYTLLSKTPVIVEDFEKEKRFNKPEILEVHGIASGASVIIGSKENIFGVLIVNSTKKRKFTADDTFFLNSVAFLIAQVIERKKAEEALKESYLNLEEKVRERTTELEKAYTCLKESEERLIEAQKLAHVGIYDWNIATDEEYWSDELYYIFGLDPQSKLNHNTFLKYIHPDDLNYVTDAINKALKGKPYYIDYRIILPDGKERIIYSQGGAIFDEENTPVRMRGIVQDITERKQAEEALANLEAARKKEIHHRIKNNLQVISSLLDLQTEKFRDKGYIKDSEILTAFKDSQDRVSSIALIHEELHEGKGTNTLNFSLYLQKLIKNLFQTYRLENANTNLNVRLEDNIFFDMDIAVPLGIIINELVSNSLKYAFPEIDRGEIQIKLCRDKSVMNENCMLEKKKEDCKGTNYILTVSDNGVGIPENFDSEDSNSLGIHLVKILVEQLGGELELKRDSGTEFIIKFNVADN